MTCGNDVLPLVYVAGPYTRPDPIENTHRALRVADDLLASGLVVPFVPHGYTMAWHLVSPKDYETWMAYDMAILRRCEALLRLSGQSEGADREVVAASRWRIPVFDDIEALYAWARGADYGEPRAAKVVVGLGHRRQQGKDAVGTILAERHGFRTISFAKALKEVAATSLTAGPPIDAALAEAIRTQGVDAVKLADDRVRSYLIALGNAVREHVGASTWVDVVARAIGKSPAANWAVTDMRYPNEAEAVRQMGGLLVKVERPGVEHHDDVADTALADFDEWDLVLRNDGKSLDDLAKLVDDQLMPFVSARRAGPLVPAG